MTASSEGVAMLIGVDIDLKTRKNINRDQFKQLYNRIARKIGIKEKEELLMGYDSSCADIVRNACLSYDPDIFFSNINNPNFQLLNLEKSDLFDEKTNKYGFVKDMKEGWTRF
ncbi:MAG: hypothetical protein IPP38_12320 [Bacteroidetes bacterium]|nr:hypothetical protein [Bacteroidota bacterium]